MEFTDRKLRLTDRQKPLRTVRTDQDQYRKINNGSTEGKIGSQVIT